MAPLRVSPDTMIFDKIAEEDWTMLLVERLTDLRLLDLLVTHVQEDELADIPDTEKRARIARIPRRRVATWGFVIGTTRLGEGRITDASDGLEEIRRDNRDKYTRDALIAVTAAKEADVFVTEDGTLARRVREELAVEVWSWARLRTELEARASAVADVL